MDTIKNSITTRCKGNYFLDSIKDGVQGNSKEKNNLDTNQDGVTVVYKGN